MCVFRPCSQKVTLSLQCESRILGFRTAASVGITNYGCESQPKCKTMLLDSLDSDADVSVVIVLCQWLNQLQNYSRDKNK